MAEKRCFIIGPIGQKGSAERKRADMLLRIVIKPVFEASFKDYQLKRADDDADPGLITSAIIRDIQESELAIADLTGFNPNAFYELGIRHAVARPVIHMTTDNAVLPFDNKDQRTIFVDLSDADSIEQASRALASAINQTEADTYQVSNPVVQSRALFKIEESGNPRDKVLVELVRRLDRLEDGGAPGIRGQGPLATMSIAAAAEALRQYLFLPPTSDASALERLIARGGASAAARMPTVSTSAPSGFATGASASAATASESLIAHLLANGLVAAEQPGDDEDKQK